MNPHRFRRRLVALLAVPLIALVAFVHGAAPAAALCIYKPEITVIIGPNGLPQGYSIVLVQYCPKIPPSP